MNVLAKKWIFVEENSDKADELGCRCDSVYTEDDIEVIGCSEWIGCEKETFAHIIELHNSWLEKQSAYNK